MKEFLKETQKGNKFELIIDAKIFSKDIVLKAAYNYLDKGYFFFYIDENKNIILQFTKKDSVNDKPEEVIGDFSDELLSVYLRDKLEKDNKDIREKIVGAAIANSLVTNNFIEINTDDCGCDESSQIDFDKDIDDILKEIENDPELKIDEEEIERILKEIENESSIGEKLVNNDKKDKLPKKDKKDTLDIEDIINNIENDNELKIDEEEIQRILKEIENEEKISLKVNIDGVKQAKEKFSEKKNNIKPKKKK